jgi:site-specific recombinase XerC
VSWSRGADSAAALFLNRYGDRLSTRAVDELVAASASRSA